MGVFNNWPYTDVHQLNLDFILEVAKEAKEAYDNIEVITQAAQDAKTAAQLSAAMAARSAERAETSENRTLAYYNNVIQIGTPIVINEAADMTQYNRVYLYTGDEAGYEFGHWYYYDDIDGEWKDGGEYGVGSAISANARNLLKYILERVVYTETGMGVYVSALYEALAGNGGGGEPTTYMIINALTHVSNSNEATGCNEGDSYTASLTPDTDYTIDTVTITMGGIDITSSTYNNGVITIASVTGDVVITATAVYTRYLWKVSDGSLSVEHQGMSATASNVVYLNGGGVADRRSILTEIENEGADIWQGTSLAVSGFYAIPVPANATSVSLSALPSGYYIAFSGFKIQNGTMVRTYSGGFEADDPHTETFAAGTYDYITALCKYGSAGSTITTATEITEFVIQFS